MIFSRCALALLIGATSSTAFIAQPAVGPKQLGFIRPSAVANVAPLHMAATLEGIEVKVDGTSVRVMRPPLDSMNWGKISDQLIANFGYTAAEVESYNVLDADKAALLKLYKHLQLCRGFENACNQQYMQGKIRGFMHLDNGQESVPGLVDYAIKKGDKKYSYYREHCHALASGVDPKAIMAELMMKDTGTCRGAGGSMHIFDKETNFQGGWALVAEQLPYACGAAKSILQDRALGLSMGANGELVDVAPPEDDDRIAIVFVGEGGAQNGRASELLNSAAKDNLPLLLIVIDNGRAINTFTPDIAQNFSTQQLRIICLFY